MPGTENSMTPAEPVFVIAECGVNHNGSLELALKLVDEAVRVGADAVKFQTFRPEALVSRAARMASYQRKAVEGEDSQLSMLASLVLKEKDHESVKAYCAQKSIEFMSTPFDEGSCDLLVRLGVKRLKIGSGDLTHLPLLRHAAATGLPLILSTGMADIRDVGDAVAAIRTAGNERISLLHCLTEYPAPVSEINLRAMATLRAAFGLPVGYSDHTVGMEASVAAVALGATIVEKHLTLDKNMVGPDHRASADPKDFADLVRAIRNITAALGDGVKRPAPSELKNVMIARRSIVTARTLTKGTRIGAADLAIKRPATGIQPSDLEKVIGMTVTQEIEDDTPLTWDMLK
jgi:N-acetylneuraminate synthase